MCHHAQLIFLFFNRDGVSPRWPAGLKVVTSGDPLDSASQSAGMTGVSHRAQLFLFFLRWDLTRCSGWSAVAQSWLTATSDSQAQATLPPQPPK